jgi:hypothetical protein
MMTEKLLPFRHQQRSSKDMGAFFFTSALYGLTARGRSSKINPGATGRFTLKLINLRSLAHLIVSLTKRAKIMESS